MTESEFGEWIGVQTKRAHRVEQLRKRFIEEAYRVYRIVGKRADAYAALRIAGRDCGTALRKSGQLR